MRLKNVSSLLLVIFLACISILLYANSLQGDYLIDDIPGIYNFAKIHNISDYFSKSFFIRPGILNEINYVLLWHFGGGKPFAFHLFNVLVHIGCVVLLFLLCNTLFRNKTLSFLSSLVFAVHPIHTEAVSWISGGGYALCSLFFLASVLFYVKSSLVKERKDSLFYLMLTAVSFGLCLLSGNSVVALPVIFIMYDIFFWKGFDRKVRKTHLLFLISIIAISVLFISIFFFTRSHFMGVIFRYRGFTYLVVAAKALVYYLKILYLPLARGLYHPFAFNTADIQKLSPALFLSIFVLIISVISFFKAKRNVPAVSFGIAWFFITYVPYSNIIPVCNIVSERYLYLPSAGFSILIAALFLKAWELINKFGFRLLRIISIIAVTLYLCSYAVLTFKRNIEYSNILTYWQSNIENFPEGYFIYNNLASTFYSLGDKNNAMAYCWILLMVNHNQPHVWFNLGNIYKDMGNIKDAENCYNEALKIDSNFVLAKTALDQIKNYKTK